MGDHLKEKTPHKMEEENKICKPICFAYFQAFLLQSSMFIGAIKVKSDCFIFSFRIEIWGLRL